MQHNKIYKVVLELSLLLLFIFAISCKVNKLEKEKGLIINNPERITFSKISCLNMAEKLAGIGTKNDEIILMFFAVDSMNNVSLIESTEILIFESESTYEIDISIDIKGQNIEGEIKLVLLEIDTERSKEELLEIVERELNVKQSDDEFKRKMNDDDLLGISIVNLKEAENKGPIKFWGFHLLDEYHYEVTYNIN